MYNRISGINSHLKQFQGIVDLKANEMIFQLSSQSSRNIELCLYNRAVNMAIFVKITKKWDKIVVELVKDMSNKILAANCT